MSEATSDWSFLSNISNVAIAAFTLVLTVVSLWQGKILHRTLLATEKSADAAIKSADAAVAAVLPVIEIAGVFIAFNEPGFQRAILQQGVPRRGSWLSLSINNVGHGPANITHCSARWTLADALPRNPEYPEAGPFSIAIKEAQTTGLDLRNVTISLNDDEQRRVHDGTAWLWVFGYLTYEDVLGSIYDVGFAAQWRPILRGSGPLPVGFNLMHDPSYHYRRKRIAQ